MNMSIFLGVALCLALVSVADCRRRRCSGKYMCEISKSTKKTCIATTKLCDGTPHCPLSDDEDNCEISEGPDCSGKYTCELSNSTEKTCIATTKLCDGTPDCPLSDDEDNCEISEGPDCRGKYACELSNSTEKTCIATTKLCDETPDCPLSDDEENCEISEGPDCSGKYTCELSNSTEKTCIATTKLCDETPDCPLSDDEENCEISEGPDCSGKYTCQLSNSTEKTCIATTKLCDETPDCPLSDDEENCEISEGCESLPTINGGVFSFISGSGDVGSIAALHCFLPHTYSFEPLECKADGTWNGLVNQTCDYTPEDVRLVDGTSSSNGRLEVLINGIWGTVCDDEFDNDNNGARAVCRMLGLPTDNAVYLIGDNVVDGSGKIWLDEVLCFGGEPSIYACSSEIHGNSCDHEEDVGVACG